MFVQRFCVYASPAEQAQLEQIASQGKTPQKVACRARLVLMLSNHEPPSAVADALRISRMTVRLWADRFVCDGVPGLLHDATRPGRRKQITPEKVQAIVEATLRTRPPAATHWSSRTLAKAQGVSDGTIRKIWRQHRLQPHRIERFKFSTDPHFVEKLRDVVGLYLNPPAKAVVFCVDEKSGIQALDRTRPVLPLRPSVPERQTHDYVRHGTTTLYAALRVLDVGKTVGAVARELDLTPSSLGNWVRHAQADRTNGKTGLTTVEREELARLRKENRVLQEERDILKKAAAFFAKQSR